MTGPGMEAVLAELMAEHDVKGDQATTGKGDPLRCRYPSCDCDGPEGPECGLPGYAEKMTDPLWFLTGSNWPAPCKRCGSREHVDCVRRDWCTCGQCWECTR